MDRTRQHSKTFGKNVDGADRVTGILGMRWVRGCGELRYGGRRLIQLLQFAAVVPPPPPPPLLRSPPRITNRVAVNSIRAPL